ncbi:Retrotransposon gag protein [Gossypium australe]|uniref:Retrotransposon gag protein n=1 Tax=Gossypium australe TaxID=47621 RepID=A0A5B6WU35_9ROSI|nr:Retrotransposon gag protein [Gossypium australe]
MQDPPPFAVGNVPCKNPLFNEANNNALRDPPAPPQLLANLHMTHNERTLRDHALPSLDMVQESITRPTIIVNNFEIKLTMIQKFSPISKVVQLIREVVVFRQSEGESFHKAWECFKMLIQKCPHHSFFERMRLEVFYKGLDGNARSRLDGAIGGALMSKMYEDAYKLKKTWH